ncbi:protein with protein kinase II-like association domain [Bernardetia litoralis DSM 6794]|uniref:Protein with protein kinase II-like association domain n=1 Tax=Bernardetia litoralis (strain ATCC 23117 / DSM 6794 / NBRC 15988 / NCIMB 1366 / Fx l1 / Sio-4) TaxID=880071 RepID=I4APZ7_BERLS|nr:nuclear transport factor 2 family protein [Bernardetia litoralis]AFM06032.1 protein with protein kinase II-like association domain [Bernardetia litoralis DSM 6794]
MKSIFSFKIYIILISIIIGISSCNSSKIPNQNTSQTSEKDKIEFKETLQKHLDAVTNRDIETLKSTLHPNGKMYLMLPDESIKTTTKEFVEYHTEWFKYTNWTFETEILYTEIGENSGLGVIQIIYREAERNGKPYFNRMCVSYTLEKFENKWYIIADHASTIEKTKSE